jgi:hypothetical protein
MGSPSQKAKQREPEVLRQAKQRLKVTLVFFWRKNGGPHLQISEMDANGSKWINLRPKIEAFEGHAHP